MFFRYTEDVESVVNDIVLFGFVEFPVRTVLVILIEIVEISGRVLLSLWKDRALGRLNYTSANV